MAVKGEAITRFERNLDWNLLKVFHEIAQAGGVSRAAGKMSRQQPAISNALKRLEDYVGVVLCRRGPQGFELTDEGRALAQICEHVHKSVRLIPDSVGEASATLSGQLRMIMVQNVVSPAFDHTIASFSQAHPSVELLINIALLQEVEEAIDKGDAEIGVAPVFREVPGLRYDVLYREQHRPFCGRRHHLFGKTISDAAVLGEEAFVLPLAEEAGAVTQYRERYGWGRRCVAQSPYLDEVRRMVVAGMGIGFLPEEMLEKDVTLGLLWPLMERQAEAQDDIFVISNPQSSRTLAIRRFLDLLQANRAMHDSQDAAS